MKKLLLMATAIVLTVGMTTSCKSQKTLADATTVATAGDVAEVAPIQYTNTRTTQQAPEKPVVMAGDRQERVTVVDANSSMLKNYNVIVGSFGSKANAEGMKSKMVSRGYTAFIVQNEKQMFRVVAGGYDTREAATSVRDIIRNTYPTETGTCAEAWLLIPEQ